MSTRPRPAAGLAGLPHRRIAAMVAGPGKDAMTDLPTPGPRPASHSIAAIIPLHNGARYIADAIRSVLAQTVAADEIVVVDDGSEDEGPAIVARLDAPRVKVIRQVNAGQSAARNRGAGHTTSALLAFLDQDVWFAFDQAAEPVPMEGKLRH